MNIDAQDVAFGDNGWELVEYECEEHDSDGESISVVSRHTESGRFFSVWYSVCFRVGGLADIGEPYEVEPYEELIPAEVVTRWKAVEL